MKLYGYWRSSSSYRVRIGLGLKGLAFEQAPVHLLQAAQREPGYVALNPMAQVPLLEVDDEGRTLLLTQSIAILEYLEERWPEPRLLPEDRVFRFEVRRAV